VHVIATQEQDMVAEVIAHHEQHWPRVAFDPVGDQIFQADRRADQIRASPTSTAH